MALQSQDGGVSSSSVSLRDPMRQRYSVTWHPRQPLLIVSDGYMLTVLRTSERPSAAAVMSAALLDAVQGLEHTRRLLASSQVSGGGIKQCWGKLLLKVMHYNIALLPKKVTNYVT